MNNQLFFDQFADIMTSKVDRSVVRRAIKEAALLHDQGHLSADFLNFIIELGLAYEMSDSIQKTEKRMEKYLWRKF